MNLFKDQISYYRKSNSNNIFKDYEKKKKNETGMLALWDATIGLLGIISKGRQL